MKTTSRLQPRRALLAAAFALLAATAAPARHAAAADLVVDNGQNVSIIANATYDSINVGVNSQGTLNQAAFTVNIGSAGNASFIGENVGSNGTYNLTGGSLALGSSSFFVGYQGNGTVAQSGSSIVTSTVGIILGSTTTGNGTYSLAGTASVNALSLTLGGYSNTNNVFNQNGGTATFSQQIAVDGGNGTRGTYNLNSGTFTTAFVKGYGGNSTFNFNGGTIQPTGSSTTFISAVTNLNVQAGGFVIDTAGLANTVAQPLLHASGGTADGGVSVNGTGSVTLSGTNTYNGATTVNTGELRFGNNATANSSTINLGGTGGTLPATVTLASTTASTLNSPMTVRSGSSGEDTLRNDPNSAAGLNYAGAITVNHDLVVADVTTGGLTLSGAITTIANSGLQLVVGSTATNSPNVNKGQVTLGGTVDNSNLGATVNSGTLVLGKTSSASVHAIGAMLTVASGATVQLGGTGGDQINNNSSVTINAGGTFKTGGLSEGSATTTTVSTGFNGLTLAGTATVDFGTGNTTGSTLAASTGQVSGAGTIRIINWTGTPGADAGLPANDHLLFLNVVTLGAAQLAQFQFVSDTGVNYPAGAQIITYNGRISELVPPVPEPGTWALVCAGAGLLGLTVHRRRAARA